MGTPRRARAFTIVEVLVVLMIFAIITAMATVITRGISAAQKRSTTTTRLAGVDAALLQMVATRKRLPCPADGTIASTANGAGVEQRDAGGNCTAMATGVVPWIALGISEQDATDGWNARLTYRVFPALALDGGMDMSWCDPAGTELGATPRACNTACASIALGSCTPPVAFLQNTGLTIQNVAGTVVMDPTGAATGGTPTGAAYVVISAGESDGGAYLNSGQLSTSSTTDGTKEQLNYANLALQPFYVDDTINDVAGTAHFDDVVSRPSVQTVASKAGLGPRSH